MAGSTYNFNHRKRGQAVVIANENFGDGNTRKAASADLRKMKSMWENLDFKVFPYKDLTRDEILDVIEKACKDKKRNKDSDCFVLVISTYGREEMRRPKDGPPEVKEWRHAVIATDLKPVYVDEIMDMFEDTPNDEYGLNGKPKLFFIQACRSNKKTDAFDHGVYSQGSSATSGAQSGNSVYNVDPSRSWMDDIDISDVLASVNLTEEVQPGNTNEQSYEDIYEDDPVWELDDKTVNLDEMKSPQDTSLSDCAMAEAKEKEETNAYEEGGALENSETPPVPFEVVTIHCPKDCLIVYPVQPHKKAPRHDENGSYLLQFLQAKKNFELLVTGKGLLRYLTQVVKDMSEYEYTSTYNLTEEQQKKLPFKMTATIVHRLTDNVHFVPKKETSWMNRMLKYFIKKMKN